MNIPALVNPWEEVRKQTKEFGESAEKRAMTLAELDLKDREYLLKKRLTDVQISGEELSQKIKGFELDKLKKEQEIENEISNAVKLMSGEKAENITQLADVETSKGKVLGENYEVTKSDKPKYTTEEIANRSTLLAAEKYFHGGQAYKGAELLKKGIELKTAELENQTKTQEIELNKQKIKHGETLQIADETMKMNEFNKQAEIIGAGMVNKFNAKGYDKDPVKNLQMFKADVAQNVKLLALNDKGASTITGLVSQLDEKGNFKTTEKDDKGRDITVYKKLGVKDGKPALVNADEEYITRQTKIADLEQKKADTNLKNQQALTEGSKRTLQEAQAEYWRSSKANPTDAYVKLEKDFKSTWMVDKNGTVMYNKGSATKPVWIEKNDATSRKEYNEYKNLVKAAEAKASKQQSPKPGSGTETPQQNSLNTEIDKIKYIADENKISIEEATRMYMEAERSVGQRNRTALAKDKSIEEQIRRAKDPIYNAEKTTYEEMLYGD